MSGGYIRAHKVSGEVVRNQRQTRDFGFRRQTGRGVGGQVELA